MRVGILCLLLYPKHLEQCLAEWVINKYLLVIE